MKKLLLFLAVAFCLNSNAQIITTVAGGSSFPFGYSGDGGQATDAELYYPTTAVMDAVGNLYIVDQSNNVIRKVNTAGIITTFAGNGTQGYSGDSAQATLAELALPASIAIDAINNVYISDQGNDVIRKVNTAGIISTFAGNGSVGFSGDGGPATAAKLYHTSGIAIDGIGNLYICDANNMRIRKVNTAGIITTIAGIGTGGYSGDGGQATAAKLNGPGLVTLDAVGNIYIIDYGNNRIRKVNTAGIINTFAGNGLNGYSGDGGQATAASFSQPSGIAIDATGNVYVADRLNYRIRKVDVNGIVSTFVGTGINGFTGDGGLACAAKINGPTGGSFDAAGNLYFADQGNNEIRKITQGAAVTYTLTPDPSPHTWDAYVTYSSSIDSAHWYWGDGSSTTGLYPSHTYSIAGRYNICVTAYSFCGDSVQSCQNDTVYRTTSGSMVYVNVDSSNAHTTAIKIFNTQNSTIKIYPNPVSTTINVSGLMKNGSVQITDMLGQEVISTSLNNKEGTITIDVSNLQSGVYFIKTELGTKKFIKQ